MLLQALEVALDGLTDVRGRLGARPALGNATGQSGTRRDEDAVLVLLQINSVLHYPHSIRAMTPVPREREIDRLCRKRMPDSGDEKVYFLRNFCDRRLLARKGAGRVSAVFGALGIGTCLPIRSFWRSGGLCG